MSQDCDQLGLQAQARGGDSEAFDALCQPHKWRLLRNTYRITRNREDAEDAIRDSFLRAFLHIDKFDGKSAFSTWLTRIAINSALMIIRKRRSSRLTDTGIPENSERGNSSGTSRSMPRIRNSVTPKARSRIFLRRRSALYVPPSELLLGCSRYRKCRQGKRREGWGFRQPPRNRGCFTEAGRSEAPCDAKPEVIGSKPGQRESTPRKLCTIR